MESIRFLLLLFASIPAFSQAPDTLFYDMNWNLINPENAVFYRVVEVDKEEIVFDGQVKDYFLTNHQLIMEGTYLAGKKEGIFTFYDTDGILVSTGHYQNNKRTGQWKYYYPNKQLHKIVVFINQDKLYEDVLYSLWDSTGKQLVTEGNGYWQDVDRNTENNKAIVLQGKVTNGKREGMWVWQYLDGEKILEESFINGVFQFGDVWENEKKYPYYGSRIDFIEPAQITKPESFLYDINLFDQAYYGEGLEYFLHTFLNIQHEFLLAQNHYQQLNRTVITCKDNFKPALYEGGPLALYRYIRSAKDQNTTPDFRKGKVIVNFTISQYGRVKNYFVSKGLSVLQNRHALDIAKKIIWIPASCNDKYVQSHLKIAINY